MWISEKAASVIFNIANYALLASLLTGLVATGLSVWMGNIKDQYGDLSVATLTHENLEIRARLAARRITAEQHKTLVQELSKWPSVFNMECMSDGESGLYASDIAKTFKDAHWTLTSSTFPVGVIWIGLEVFETNDPAAVKIARALKDAKIPFFIGKQWRDRATIMVGAKPAAF